MDSDPYRDSGHYRDQLTAALVRIEQLEEEVALFRIDPGYERVDIAEERLARARAQRRRLQKILPRACVASFVAVGAFALTDPSLPTFVHFVGYALSCAGLLFAIATMVWLLVLSAQGEKPKRLLELEQQVRLAKGDVGRRLRIEAQARHLLGSGPLHEEIIVEAPSPSNHARG